MRTRSISAVAQAFVALSGVALLSCQTYDFEPVQPLAIAQTTQTRVVVSRKAKPNMMLVVDKSGSMLLPSGDGSRLSAMQGAMETFLSQFGSTARLGLTVFPNASDGNTCTSACPPGIVVEPISTSNDVPSELEEQATKINQRIQDIGTNKPGALPAAGGTPTASTLNVVSNQPSLLDEKRDDFVLLLTDGEPNCNNSLNPDTCPCTNTVCASADQACSCLDDNASVLAIQALRAKGIRTIVVGFGAETGASGARVVLNKMAEAGDFERKCETAADCGGTDTCDDVGGEKFCSTRFYQAADAAELAAALAAIGNKIPGVNPCVFELESKPEDPRLLAVYVGEHGADPTKVDPSPTTWSFVESDTGGSVTFTGDICTSLENATELDPVKVEIRLVQPL